MKDVVQGEEIVNGTEILEQLELNLGKQIGVQLHGDALGFTFFGTLNQYDGEWRITVEEERFTFRRGGFASLHFRKHNVKKVRVYSITDSDGSESEFIDVILWNVR